MDAGGLNGVVLGNGLCVYAGTVESFDAFPLVGADLGARVRSHDYGGRLSSLRLGVWWLHALACNRFREQSLGVRSCP